MLADVGDGIIQTGDDFHVQIQRQKLVVILFSFHRNHISRSCLQCSQRHFVSVQSYAALCHLLAQCWQKTRGDILMHQQSFYGVACARTLGFGIDDNLQGRGDLRGIINIDMTYANAAGDDRDSRLLTTQLVQARATARDQHIDVLIHP